jgi:hypothetical protein
MKKLLIIISILLTASLSNAQTWWTANQVTVAWDAVAPPKDAQGVDLPGVIKYQTYYRTDLVSLGTILGGEVEQPQATVTVPGEGRFWLGVETVRYVDGQPTPFRSTRKAWSNVAEDCGPDGPFGVMFFIAPGSPGGLKFQP